MKRLILLIIGIGLGSNGFSQLSLNDSLVAHFPFNGNANDETGNGYDGTVYGTTLSSDRFGNPNSAYEFDGVDDYINTFSTFDFEFRTMTLWVKPFNIQGDGVTEKHIAGQDANTLNYGQLKAKFANGNLAVRAGGETNNHLVSVNNNTWYHITLVRDGSSCSYYLNNILIGSASSGTVGSISSPNEDFVIGAGRDLDRQFFHGIIDDIRIYNRALSSSEIDSLYNEQNPTLSTVENKQWMNDILVYPNPTKENIHVSCDRDILRLRLLNGQGEMVMDAQNTKSLSIRKLSKGIYFLLIDLEDGNLRQIKIVIN